MKTELIFPTPIWKFDDVNVDRESLTNFVYLVKDEDPALEMQLWSEHMLLLISLDLVHIH